MPDYGPTLYKNLGFNATKQLLYPAAWLTFSWGMNVVGMLLIESFPRNIFIGGGVLGCMATLIVEAALVANYAKSSNENGLRAAVAMLFVFQVFYSGSLDGMASPFDIESMCGTNIGPGSQFSYLGELFPTHLRAKGVCLGVAMISLMNVIWLQAAPVAFEYDPLGLVLNFEFLVANPKARNVGWRFYLAFIIPGTLGAIVILLFFPNTRGLPLEEIAALFGDEDEVAVYQREIDIDQTTHEIADHHRVGEKEEFSSGTVHAET